MLEKIKKILYLLLLAIICSILVSFLLNINTISCIRFAISGFLITFLIIYIVIKMVDWFEE